MATMKSDSSGTGQHATDRPSKPRVKRKGTRVRRGTAPALLLVAAQELFAERGPLGTTTREIAERADVTEDLIFRYYGSKNGLLQEAVIKPLLESLEALRVQWIDAAAVRSDWDDDRAREFVGQLYNLVAGNRTVVMTMAHVLQGGPSELDDTAVREITSELFAPLGPAFDNRVGDGTSQTDSALTLRLIMILIGATAAYLGGTYSTADQVPPKDQIIEGLVMLIQYGIRQPPKNASI
jgi:AcrR family transcriptional regulator